MVTADPADVTERPDAVTPIAGDEGTIINQNGGNIQTDIAAQSVNNISTDIAAQSVGDIDTNIASQSLGQVDTNIAAQTVGDLAVDIAAQTISNLGIDIEAQTLGDVTIGGDGGSAFSQTVTGAIRNDTYQNGNSFNISSYPTTIDPTETIFELTVFSIPSGQTLDITTSAGDTLTDVSPQANNFVIGSLEIDSVTFNDDGNTSETSGFWAGE